MSKRSALQQNERGRSQQPSSFRRIEGKVFCLLFFGNSSDKIKEKKECGNKSWAKKGSLSRKRTGFRKKISKGGRGNRGRPRKWSGQESLGWRRSPKHPTSVRGIRKRGFILNLVALWSIQTQKYRRLRLRNLG